MTSPCLDCKDRQAECHSTCSAYKLFKGVSNYRSEKMNREKKKVYDSTSRLIDAMIKRKY